jgi:hypothetical protein
MDTTERRAMIERLAMKQRRRRVAAASRVRARRVALANEATIQAGRLGFNPGRVATMRTRSTETIRLGETESARGIVNDPAMAIAYRIQKALTAPVRAGSVTVMDREGRVIATVDPVTRKRTGVQR